VSDQAAKAEHQCFTAKLQPAPDKASRAHIYHQAAPVRGQNSTTISLRIPVLTIAAEVARPLEIAKRIAEILNAHWETHGQPETPAEPEHPEPAPHRHPGLDPGSSLSSVPVADLHSTAANELRKLALIDLMREALNTMRSITTSEREAVPGSGYKVTLTFSHRPAARAFTTAIVNIAAAKS